MLEILASITIFPLYAFFEIVFKFFITNAHNLLEIIGIIFIISLLVNLLCAPLYYSAELLQIEEDKIQQKIKKRVQSIKKNFKGDEKYLLLSTYYRQNNYNPLMVLRNYYSLLLQIPIFIAAFYFFSNLDIYGFVPDARSVFDLTKPDNLISLFGFKINVLPILMTFFNCAAALIYAHKHPTAHKAQLWIIPAVFLVLLYNQPSILLIYWTFNNFLSMLKNIFICYCSSKANNRIYFSLVTVCALFFLFSNALSLFSLIFSIGFLGYLVYKRKTIVNFINNLFKDNANFLFFISAIGLTVLIGLYVPSCVLSASPLDIPSVEPYFNTLPYLLTSLMQSIGIFIFWGGIVYLFSNKLMKKFFACFYIVIFFLALANFITVHYPKGMLNPDFTFNITMGVDALNFLNVYLNYILLFIVSALVLLLMHKQRVIFKNLLYVILLALLTGSIINMTYIYKVCKEDYKNTATQTFELNKEFHLSKTKKNVIVLVLDRAISAYLPIIFKEKPELLKQYSGFTYYPNTVSYAGSTIYSFPSMFGGYEYTPEKWFYYYTHGQLDAKYKESQFVLPKLFKNNGFDVTLADIPFSEYGYSIISKNDFEKEQLKHIKIANKYGKLYLSELFEKDKYLLYVQLLNRNLIYYSFLRTSPASLRLKIYDKGKYFNTIKANDYTYYNYTYDNYAELFYLPKLVDFSSKKPTFNVIINCLTHDPALLQKPDYTLFNKNIKNKYKLDIENENITQEDYDVNAAGLILTGKFLEYLKANGVYDNTRIIIASDHGCPYYVKTKYSEDITRTIMNYNPVLMIKDFDSNTNFSTNNKFQTLADLPQIIIKDIIKNPTNPYTKKPLTASTPKEAMILMHVDGFWQKDQFDREPKFYKKHARFRNIKENIFDLSNWGPILDYNTVEANGLIKP